MNGDNQFTIDQLLLLWGKTDKLNEANYHPVLYHLIDVASAALEMWKMLPVRIRTRLCAAVGVKDERRGQIIFALLAGLHDLGKACPNFQQKAPQFLPVLKGIGLDFPPYANPRPHNYVSVPEVIRLFRIEHTFPVSTDQDLARQLSYALGAHHGIFPTPLDVSTRTITRNVLGDAALWHQMRDELVRQLIEALPKLPVRRNGQLIADMNASFPPLLAAYISVADWFGSSQHFPIQGARLRTHEYSAFSRRCARAALRKSGWIAPPAAPAASDFTTLFGYLNRDVTVRPNALQRTVDKLLEDTPGPALWIIEEEMGAGKTEAAFMIFDKMRVQSETHGLYIAMPTQATSNAMHGRLRDFLHKGRGEKNLNLILAHSHATLDETYRKRIVYGDQFKARVYDDSQGEKDSEEGVLRIRAWFTANKQTLLSHYGVGTIDQALMGVLQTRHWFVRLFGLAGKVVIFDEVHAYDAYMNTLLQLLITWLSELDCTVILLSATLPRSTRFQLAEAYRKSASSCLSAPDAQTAYPRISLISKAAAPLAKSLHIKKTDIELHDNRKTVLLEHISTNSDAVKVAIFDAIPGDGCAIVICNTVKRAQEMFRELSTMLEPEGWHCTLFHARMPFCWRKETEEDVISRFGKNSGEKGTKPRPKTLLVATQVVEQSLDLDADFMASELAPIDLMLQRMGRLWRHRRGVNARSADSPRFAIMCDLKDDGLPDLGKWKAVYAEHTLLRSWLGMRDRKSVLLPDDIEPLVKDVYDAPDPSDLSLGWTEKLDEAAERLQAEDHARSVKAAAVSVRPQQDGDDFLDWIGKLNPVLTDEEDPETHNTLRALTRDGDPSITIVCCGSDNEGRLLALDPDGEITSLQAAEMLQFSLSLSQKGLFHALKTPTFDNSPANWRKAGHLKYVRRVQFDNGICSVNEFTLKLTREYGLEYS